MIMRRIFHRCLLLVGLGGCGEASLAPLPLDVGISASRITAAPGDSINFLVTAQGGTLIGIETTYGDGALEQYNTSGARTALVTFRHAYGARGTYLVEATVFDGSAGSKSATVEVRVN